MKRYVIHSIMITNIYNYISAGRFVNVTGIMKTWNLLVTYDI